MEDITDADYAHKKRVFEDFEIKLGEYHDLHVQNYTLLLADYLKTFQICALKYMSLILQSFFQLLDEHDKQL